MKHKLRPASPRAILANRIYSDDGLPYHYSQDPSRILCKAVGAYLGERTGGPPAPPDQLDLVVRFLQYFIEAPCWINNAIKHDYPEAIDDINSLRERAKDLASAESIARWLEEAADCGIDPL